MASQFKLTDGTDEVNLLPTVLSELMPTRGGLGPSDLTLDLELNPAPDGVGGSIQSMTYPPIVEEWKLQVFASGHDAAAAEYQKFIRLLRKAVQYRLPDSRWQKDSVYIIAQGETETNARYSLVIGPSSWSFPDIFRPEYASGKALAELTFSIMREPIWRSSRPGMGLSYAMWSERKMRPARLWRFGARENLFASKTLAGNGEFAGSVIINGSSVAYWRDIVPANETEFTIEFILRTDEIEIASGEGFYILVAENDSASDAFVVYLDYLGGDYRITAVAIKDDLTEAANFGPYTVNDGEKVKVYWKAATAPAANNGIFTLFINDVQKQTASNLDTDTREVDRYDLGYVTGAGSSYAGRVGFDDLKIDLGGDGSTWDYITNWESTSSFEPVGNIRQNRGITHIFNYDDSLTAFSENKAFNEDGWNPFVVSGSTPAVGDCIYIGSTDATIWNVVFNQTTAFQWSFTYVIEYYTGSWTSTDGPKEFDQYFKYYGGRWNLSFHNDGTSIAATSINGVSAYWIRIRITAVTDMTTVPQFTDVVSMVGDRFIEIPASKVPGDLEALVAIRMFHQPYTLKNGIGWIALGKKSRGLEYFESTIGLNDEPSGPGMTVSNGSDTTQITATWAPEKRLSRTTFATATNLQDRVTININGAAIKAAYEGTYRAYALVRQSAGNAGDVGVQLVLKTHSHVTGEIIDLKQADEWELVDLGRFDIYPPQIIGSEEVLYAALQFTLRALSYNGSTPQLDWYQLILLPLDESACVVTWDSLANQLLITNAGVSLDSGFYRYGATQFRWDGEMDGVVGTAGYWSTYGLPLTFEPNMNSRVYFITASFDAGTDELNAEPGAVLWVGFQLASRWFNLRGAD